MGQPSSRTKRGGQTVKRATRGRQARVVKSSKRGKSKYQQIKIFGKKMSLIRVLLAIIFPPLAVADQGCGSFLIVFLLTCLAWIPGVIAALIILNKPR